MCPAAGSPPTCTSVRSVNFTLTAQRNLEERGGRTTHGVFARVAQRLLAMAARIWRNWNIGAVAKWSSVAFDR